MIKKLNLKRFFAIMAIFTISLMAVPMEAVKAVSSRTYLYVSNGSYVDEGAIMKFTLEFTGDLDGLTAISKNDITLNGFSASDVKISKGSRWDDNQKNMVVSLVGVSGAGEGKSITVKYAGGKTARSTNFRIVAKDTEKPVVKFSNPTPSTVQVGGTVSYNVTYSDNVGINEVNFCENCIDKIGFTADVTVTDNGNGKTITLSNIQGTPGEHRISISGGAVTDTYGNLSEKTYAPVFIIAGNTNPNPTPTPTPTPDPDPTPDPEPENKPADWIPNPNTGRM